MSGFLLRGNRPLLCVLCGNQEAAVASLLDRAARYVEKMPAAESGNHGHDATFAVAVTLVHGFALPEAEAWPILCEFNKRCLPPWMNESCVTSSKTLAG